jgi:tetratricopeptide (TPR) repeat protein
MAFNKAKAVQEAEKYVSQGKTALAIKQYLQIVEKDPADLSLYNTIGDLYVREKNVGGALKYFNKVADAWVQDGFPVRAIAIYKKISKLDPSAVDALAKLGELYAGQGLTREAREQYTLVVDFYRKKNQGDKALDFLRKIVRLDPENNSLRLRVAQYLEQLGRKDDAAKAYLETAEAASQQNDHPALELALKRAA